MAQSIYLVNPASDATSYFSADILAGSGLPLGAMVADLATPTIAALAPADFDIAICDENVSPVDFDHSAEWVGITGKVSQWRRMVAIADEFRRRGKRVIIGGPHASLVPELLRPHCDVLVRGEVEELAPEFFADLRAGRPREEYVGGKPDLALSPVPRWDLYPNDRAMSGAVQTSRGCPFECEFCDVIQYLGRKQRHKPIANVLAELEESYRVGHVRVFLADDNFTVYRQRCKELLAAMSEWRRGHPINFLTQVSIDAARDSELLDMCADAGISQVFIGVETPNEESLRETKKRQNLHVDLAGQLQHFVEHGISIIGGMIAGFDADGPDIFQQQFDFAMSTPVPIFSVGALVAPRATPLYDRIAAEGRLIETDAEVEATPWTTNILPRKMSTDDMRDGMQRLCNALYAPAAFGERMLRFIDRFGRARAGAPAAAMSSAAREINTRALQVVFGLRDLGEDENRMWRRVWAAADRRPETRPAVVRDLFQYAQIRYMYRQQNYWEPRLAKSFAAA